MRPIPLVLLPGLLCDAALWRHQSESLADLADIRVADVTRDDQVAAAAARVLATAPDEFALAGLSLGGYVAFEILRQAPDRVRRLALVGSSARADPPEKFRLRQDLITLAGTGEFRGVTPRLLPRLIHPERLGDAALAETILSMAERVGRDAFLRQERLAMMRPDSRHDLALIHCPTLVVCGRQDALTPLEESVEMAEKLPRGTLIIIEECGHLAPLERPQAVSALFRYWLQA